MNSPVAPIGKGRARDVATGDWSPRPRHLVYLIAGLCLMVIGHLLMARQPPPVASFPFVAWLDRQYRLELPNLDDVVLASVLLVAGGMAAAWSGVSRRFAEPVLLGGDPPPSAFGARVRVVAALLGGAAALLGILLWQVHAGTNPAVIQTPLWIAAIGLTAGAALVVDRGTRAPLSPGLARFDFVALAVLCAAGLMIGIYDLGRVPDSMLGDEGQFWETARNIATGAYRPSAFSPGPYSFPVLASVGQAAVLRLFDPSLWSWRFSSVLAGVLAVIPTYLLARELYGRRVGVIAGATMIAMPYFLAFSRLGYISSQALLPAALALYLLYAGLRRRSLLYAALGGTAAGFGFYTFTAARLSLLTGSAFLVYLLLGRVDWRRVARLVGIGRPRRRRRPGGPGAGAREGDSRTLVLGLLAAAFLAGCAVTALPYQVYGNRFDQQAVNFKMAEAIFPNRFYVDALFKDEPGYRSLPATQVGDQTLYLDSGLWGRLLVRGVIRTLLVFNHPRMITEHYIDGPLAGRGTAVLFTLGVFLALGRLRQGHFALPIIWLVLGMAALSALDTFPPRHTHMVSIIPVMAIFTALGVAAVADGIAAVVGPVLRVRARPDPRPGLSLLVAGVLVAVVVAAGLRSYFVDAHARYRPDFEQALAFRVLALDAPRRVVYVASGAQDQGFIPWVIRQMPTLARYQAVPRDDLAAGRFTVDPQTPYLFYFRESDREVVVPFLEQTLRHAVVPRADRSSRGDVVALSYEFGP
jgi:hypothetical protein